MKIAKATDRKFDEFKVKNWRISRLPELTQNRNWLKRYDMISLIMYAFPAMEDDDAAKAMLTIGVANSIIEHDQKDNLYRIKPEQSEAT